jgi:hypothetical protein
LSNSYSTVTQDPIAGSIAAIMFGERPAAPNVRAAVLSQATLLSYEGHYQFGSDFFTPDAKFQLVAQPHYLLLEIGDGTRPLVPLNPAEFLEREFFGYVAPMKDAQGKVTGLTIRYGTRDFHAARLDAEPASAQ